MCGLTALLPPLQGLPPTFPTSPPSPKNLLPSSLVSILSRSTAPSHQGALTQHVPGAALVTPPIATIAILGFCSLSQCPNWGTVNWACRETLRRSRFPMALAPPPPPSLPSLVSQVFLGFCYLVTFWLVPFIRVWLKARVRTMVASGVPLLEEACRSRGNVDGPFRCVPLVGRPVSGA